jgi:hypothetical protein
MYLIGKVRCVPTTMPQSPLESPDWTGWEPQPTPSLFLCTALRDLCGVATHNVGATMTVALPTAEAAIMRGSSHTGGLGLVSRGLRGSRTRSWRVICAAFSPADSISAK